MEQGDAAAAVGISRVSLSRYENGRQRPPHDIVDQLLNVYAETIRARNAKYPDTRGIGNVSRGTVQESPGAYVADLKAGAMWVDLDPRTRSRLDRLDAFERAMVRERATDEDVKFIRARGVAFLRSLRVDDYLEEVDDDEDAAEAAVDAEFDNYLAHVIAPIVRERMDARRLEAPNEPIAPSQMIEAEARRRDELADERKKKRAR